MKHLILIVTGLALVASLAAGGLAATAKAPKTAQIVIRHQVRGCHTWSVNGGPFRATQSMRLARGGAVTFVDDDMMPHKLIQKGGPAVRYAGNPAMKHIGASVKVVFAKAGVYRFTTKAGEDYMPMKTKGEDNVLRLTVKVS
jgi:plastocyanin